jgi:hypothetical protein
MFAIFQNSRASSPDVLSNVIAIGVVLKTFVF